ncbi:acyl-CoA thioesterase [Desulfocastanea catecholica]
MIEHKKIVTEIKTRFRDIDSMGHVNNAVYLTYFEEGRKEFLYSLFGIINPEDYNFILAHIACDFLKPIKISDTVSLEIWVGKIGGKRFDFIYKLLKKGVNENESSVCANGRSVQVFFDYKQNITLPIPAHIRKKLSEFSSEEMAHQKS